MDKYLNAIRQRIGDLKATHHQGKIVGQNIRNAATRRLSAVNRELEELRGKAIHDAEAEHRYLKLVRERSVLARLCESED